jgi:hypothetical protein
MSTALNCAAFEVRHDFAGYAGKLIDATGGDLTQLAPCRRQVCGALWGDGNPDISGIGVRRPSATATIPIARD